MRSNKAKWEYIDFNKEFIKIIDEILKMELGFRTAVISLDGKKRWVPDSVAFDAMSHEEFKEYFDTAIKALTEATGFDVLQKYYEMTGQNGVAA